MPSLPCLGVQCSMHGQEGAPYVNCPGHNPYRARIWEQLYMYRFCSVAQGMPPYLLPPLLVTCSSSDLASPLNLFYCSCLEYPQSGGIYHPNPSVHVCSRYMVTPYIVYNIYGHTEKICDAFSSRWVGGCSSVQYVMFFTVLCPLPFWVAFCCCSYLLS